MTRTHLCAGPRELDPEPNRFGGELLLYCLPPTYRRYRTGEAMTYDSARVGRVVVPRGSETDFASIPRALWWLFPPAGFYAPASIVHDRLYRTARTAPGPSGRTVSRREGDAVFLDAMAGLAATLAQAELAALPRGRVRRRARRARIAAASVSRWLTRWAMWAAVRAFGWHSFNPHSTP